MQLTNIYSIYDRKAQYYLPVFQHRSNADAIRDFANVVTSSETPIAQYPADYDLVIIGSLDLESGQITPQYPCGTVLNGLVALTNAQAERGRYKAILAQQMDIEEIIAENP